MDVPENIALKPPLQIDSESNSILQQTDTQNQKTIIQESNRDSSTHVTEDTINHFESNQADNDHSRMLLVNLTETDKPEEDQFLLKAILQTLLEYPGNDRVDLLIHKDGTQWRLEMPIIRTGFCEELSERLIELTGSSDTISVEEEANTSAA